MNEKWKTNIVHIKLVVEERFYSSYKLIAHFKKRQKSKYYD